MIPSDQMSLEGGEYDGVDEFGEALFVVPWHSMDSNF